MKLDEIAKIQDEVMSASNGEDKNTHYHFAQSTEGVGEMQAKK